MRGAEAVLFLFLCAWHVFPSVLAVIEIVMGALTVVVAIFVIAVVITCPEVKSSFSTVVVARGLRLAAERSLEWATCWSWRM